MQFSASCNPSRHSFYLLHLELPGQNARKPLEHSSFQSCLVITVINVCASTRVTADRIISMFNGNFKTQ